MKKFILCLCLFLGLAASVPAFAMTLDEARVKGLVGEKLDGYVGVVTANGSAQALANDINNRRKEEYARISAANGQPISVVAKLAAEQVINGLPSGALYQSPNGGWQKK